ncbi:glycosyltransferase [Gilliamella mensalis]|uniref:glycosyltransferase n=1 Tax=Gilliamella mensalis TaxID=1908520 RepID=UPI000A1539E6|nr:glycosyltransferase [Gilliamella mensalis]
MIPNNLTCLQNILIPNKTFGSNPSKYLHSHLISYSSDEIIIFAGGIVSFDSYYNALSLPVWKEQCGLDRVEFRARGKGKAIIKLFIATIGTDYELASATVELNNSEQFIFECDLSKIENRGLIYTTISPIDDKVVFNGGGWYTYEQPKRDVVLGISVTHFNRKKYVLPAIERVKKNILDNKYFSSKILFTIVDNSKNITKEEANGVNVIPNENTGGSGGFMRGLLHYETNTNATHVLFMDDDASCETESILRAYWILSYALKDNSVVSGSLFMDDRPDFLIEKGAQFDAICKPNCYNYNVADRHSMLVSELGYHPKANYGAWWFFAFPIKSIKNYTFPFFVRGDDIFFGISNDFNYISPIGIACYGENFATKSCPLNMYLDTRNHIINSFYLKNPIKKILKTYKLFYLDALYSHKYETVLAIRLALHHVLGDIDFWFNNYDLSEVRKEINSFVKVEKFHDINMDSINPVFTYKRRRKIVKKLTFNGLLLPMKSKIAYQDFNYCANYDHIFRFKNILYYKPNNNTGYIARVSRVKFFKLLFCLYIDVFKMKRNYKANLTKYENNFGKLTSRDFWIKILKI